MLASLQTKYAASRLNEKGERPSAVPSQPDSEEASQTIDWSQVAEWELRKLGRLKAAASTDHRAFAFLEGCLLHLEGRYDEALASLKNALDVQVSQRPSVYLKMGEVCLACRNWEAATDAYTTVIELDPLNAQALFGLARVALNQRAWDVAVERAFAAACQHFYHAPTHLIAGIALEKLGRYSEAKSSFERAVDMDPVNPSGHRLLARFLRDVQGDLRGYEYHLARARSASKKLREFRAIGWDSEMDVDRPAPKSAGLMEDTVNIEPTKLQGDLPPLEDSIVIVSGLPRSGTSMMMQMLQAGGIPLLVDGHREPDESNSRGYFEHANAKKLGQSPDWIAASKGKAVKVVAQLLRSLSTRYRYRIIFMQRPLDEVVASQKKMLERDGKQGGKITDEALAAIFEKQIMHVRTWLNHFRNLGILDFLELDYHSVLSRPEAIASELAEFLGNDFDRASAVSAVDSTLWRERSIRLN